LFQRHDQLGGIGYRSSSNKCNNNNPKKVKGSSIAKGYSSTQHVGRASPFFDIYERANYIRRDRQY